MYVRISPSVSTRLGVTSLARQSVSQSASWPKTGGGVHLAGRAVYCCGLRVTASAPSEPKLAWYLRRSLDNPRLLLQWFSTDKVVLGPTTSSRPTSLRRKHSTRRSVLCTETYIHTTSSSINQSIDQKDGYRSRGRCRSPFKPKSVVTRRSAAPASCFPSTAFARGYIDISASPVYADGWLSPRLLLPPRSLPHTHTHGAPMSFPWRRGLRKCWRPPGSACPIMARVCPSSIHVSCQSAPLAICAALRNRPCEVELGHSVAHQWELCSCSNVLAADGSSCQHRVQHHVVLLATHQRSPCHALVFPQGNAA